MKTIEMKIKKDGDHELCCGQQFLHNIIAQLLYSEFTPSFSLSQPHTHIHKLLFKDICELLPIVCSLLTAQLSKSILKAWPRDFVSFYVLSLKRTFRMNIFRKKIQKKTKHILNRSSLFIHKVNSCSEICY